jgi:putative transposase
VQPLRFDAIVLVMSASDTSRLYHVWFSTKGRKRALFEEIRETVLAEFSRVALEIPLTILAVEAIEDHVHLLVELHGDQKLASVMHRLKGASARTVLLRYPDLRLDMHSNSFWQKSYGSRPVPPNQAGIVRRYIQTQELRPLRHQ